MTRTLNYKEKKSGTALVFHGAFPTVLSSFVWQVFKSEILKFHSGKHYGLINCIFYLPPQKILVVLHS